MRFDLRCSNIGSGIFISYSMSWEKQRKVLINTYLKVFNWRGNVLPICQNVILVA